MRSISLESTLLSLATVRVLLSFGQVKRGMGWWLEQPITLSSLLPFFSPILHQRACSQARVPLGQPARQNTFIMLLQFSYINYTTCRAWSCCSYNYIILMSLSLLTRLVSLWCCSFSCSCYYGSSPLFGLNQSSHHVLITLHLGPMNLASWALIYK